MGAAETNPIPTPALPLKGREKPCPLRGSEYKENHFCVIQPTPAWGNKPMQPMKARHAR